MQGYNWSSVAVLWFLSNFIYSIYTHSHTNRTVFHGNLWLSILLKDTSNGLGEMAIKRAALQLLDNPFYHLSHNAPMPPSPGKRSDKVTKGCQMLLLLL